MEILITQLLLLTIWGMVVNYTCSSTKKKEMYFLPVAFCSMLFVHSMVDIKSIPDLDEYLFRFRIVHNYTFDQLLRSGVYTGREFEIGFGLFNKIVASFTDNFHIFLWVYNIILLGSFFYFIHKYSVNVVISILLFLLGGYNISFFVLRQFFAIAIFVLSMKFVIDRRLLPFLLLIILASSFHESAFICLPVYFLYQFKNKKLFIAGFVLFVVLVLSNYFLLSSVLSNYFNNINVYVEDERELANYKPGVIRLLYCLIYIFALKRHVFEEGINRALLVLILLDVILLLCGIGMSARGIGRLSLFYSWVTIISFPIALSYIRSEGIRILLIILVFGIYIYSFLFSASAAVNYMENLRLII